MIIKDLDNKAFKKLIGKKVSSLVNKNGKIIKLNTRISEVFDNFVVIGETFSIYSIQSIEVTND